MPIILKKHNKETYKKVLEHLKESNRAAVIHPTGTGKSYIALKLIEDNKDKKALYVAPSNSILHNIKKNIFESGMNMSDFSNLKRITYSKLASLSDEEIEALGVDIIILDEFHHCGAPEWGNGVNRLLNKFKNSKVLGLSATPIRYFDNARDMAEELFEGSIASEMSLEETIERDILPSAKYVSALYGYTEELENMRKNIDKITDTEKRVEAERLFTVLKQKLDKDTKNLPELLSEHMVNKDGKYIVFCKDINDMKEKMANADKIFGSVNSNIKTYSVSSEKDLKENDNTLTEFENDKTENTLKLMFSVNMLNEGYHINDLDGVVMMRPTFSPTIFAQQLGRALTIKKEDENHKPVIIDLVNNFDSCKIIEDFCKKINEERRKRSGRTNEKSEEKISIFDNTKEFRDIASRITELYKRNNEVIRLDEKIEIFEKFMKIGQELNRNTIFEGYPIGVWAIQIRSQVKNDRILLTEEQKENLEKMNILESRVESNIDEKIDSIINWIQKYPEAKMRVASQNNLKKILLDYANPEDISDMEAYEELMKRERKIARNKPHFSLSGIDGTIQRLEWSLEINDIKKYLAYDKLFMEYQKNKRYYDYIRARNSNKKLSPERFERCKEGGFEGPFGYPSQVEEILKKSDIKPEVAMSLVRKNKENKNLANDIENLAKKYRLDESKIVYILNKYGTMDEFIKMYLFGRKDPDTGKYSTLYKIDYEDLEILENNIIPLRDVNFKSNTGLDEFAEISLIGAYQDNQKGFLGLYNSEKFLKVIKRNYLEKTLEIIFDAFGVQTEKKLTHAEIAEKHNLSRTRIFQVEKNARRKLVRSKEECDLCRLLPYDELKENEVEFIMQKLGNSVFYPDKKYSNEPINTTTEDLEKVSQYIKAIKNSISKFKEENPSINIDDLNLPPELYERIKKLGMNQTTDKANITFKDQDLLEVYTKKYITENRETPSLEEIAGELFKAAEEFYKIEKELTFSVRTFNALRRVGIATFEDVLKNRYKIGTIRNLGKKGIQEVLDKIKEHDGAAIKIAISTGNFSRLPVHTLGITKEENAALTNSGIESVEDLIGNIDKLATLEGVDGDFSDELLKKISDLGIMKKEDLEKEKEKLNKERERLRKDPTLVLVEDLGLSKRALTSISIWGRYKTVQELIDNKHNIGKLRNIGAKTIEEILEKIKPFEESQVNEEERIEDKKIHDLGLSTRTLAALSERGKIETVRDLLEAKESERLHKIYGLGKKGLNEVLAKIEEIEKTQKQDLSDVNSDSERKEKENILQDYMSEDAKLDETLVKARRMEELRNGTNVKSYESDVKSDKDTEKTYDE